MTFVYLLQAHSWLLYSGVGVLGLIVGSFLNVVIARYPVMLQRTWRADCMTYLNLPDDTKYPHFNLWIPRSHCPECKTPIRAWQNIPLLSFIALRGRCAQCQTCISWIYLAIELATALLSIWVAYHFGITWKMLAALVLTWGLITLSIIDAKTQLLPDTITLGLLWTGLLLNVFHLFTSAELAIVGAAVGYGVLWTIAKLFKWLRKKDGMGHGDFKLLAMLCAWLGVGALLNIILIASISSLVVTLTWLACGKLRSDEPFAFGPFLAFGGFVSLMYGPMLFHWLMMVNS